MSVSVHVVSKIIYSVITTALFYTLSPPLFLTQKRLGPESSRTRLTFAVRVFFLSLSAILPGFFHSRSTKCEYLRARDECCRKGLFKMQGL